jgi:hypothetical protein
MSFACVVARIATLVNSRFSEQGKPVMGSSTQQRPQTKEVHLLAAGDNRCTAADSATTD